MRLAHVVLLAVLVATAGFAASPDRFDTQVPSPNTPSLPEWSNVETMLNGGSGRGTDVQITTVDSIYRTALVHDPTTNNLLVNMLFQEAGASRWLVYFSNDGGTTWTFRRNQQTGYYINDMDVAVIDGYAYAFWTGDADQSKLFAYRISMSDGIIYTFPDGSPFKTVQSVAAPESITEVEVASSIDIPSFDDRLSVFCITSTGSLTYQANNPAWDLFSVELIYDNDAYRGLSVATDEGYGENWLYVSYIDSTEYLQIAAIDSSYSSLVSTATWSSDSRNTAIGAYYDTVYCFYEADGPASSYHVHYQWSTDGGATWADDFIAGNITMSECPSIELSRGGGIGVLYRYYNVPRELDFTWRGYSDSTWSDTVHVADHQPYYEPASITYMGGGKYGVVYISWWQPLERGAFFDIVNRCCRGMRGNVDGDAGEFINIVDMTWLVAYLFTGGEAPVCMEEADINGDDQVNIVDMTYLTAYLFTGGDEPVECP